ncbi:hypothetical protein ACQ9RW_004346 [Escherichia coli]
MTNDYQVLRIENAYETAGQLRELANNEIDNDLFAVTSTSENGTEIEFERPITDLALDAAYTIDALLAEIEVGINRLTELQEIKNAAEKLVRCKGRYRAEQNYRALAALFDVKAPELPPLEKDDV